MTEQPKTEYAVRVAYPGEDPYIKSEMGDLTAEEAAEIAESFNSGNQLDSGRDLVVATVVSRTVTPWTEVTR